MRNSMKIALIGSITGNISCSKDYALCCKADGRQRESNMRERQ